MPAAFREHTYARTCRLTQTGANSLLAGKALLLRPIGLRCRSRGKSRRGQSQISMEHYCPGLKESNGASNTRVSLSWKREKMILE